MTNNEKRVTRRMTVTHIQTEPGSERHTTENTKHTHNMDTEPEERKAERETETKRDRDGE
jgi:hypothetical protein